MVNTYKHFINNPQIESGFYNAGFENISILDIARLVQEKVECKVEVLASNDPRSYRQDSSKLLKTGFQPMHLIKDAIDDICNYYKVGKLKAGDINYTVKWMKKNSFK